MTAAESLRSIIEILARKLREKGLEPPVIGPDTVLLGDALEIDSLDLATVVVELEERTGKDPFREGFITFRTAGELAALYADQPG